ncbi:hypothetical protein Sjap_015182 [Stephania japonica]|uniref:RING-type domain-containing protein n=1 Tax=Stephania japonica TaxID=461633 RepID=A0AAP0IJF0_9MAGN
MPKGDSYHVQKRHAKCAVCMCEVDYDDNEETMQLKCNHRFHKTCLERWVGRATCPLCRGSLLPRNVIEGLGEKEGVVNVKSGWTIMSLWSYRSEERCKWWLSGDYKTILTKTPTGSESDSIKTIVNRLRDTRQYFEPQKSTLSYPAPLLILRSSTRTAPQLDRYVSWDKTIDKEKEYDTLDEYNIVKIASLKTLLGKPSGIKP